MDFREAAIGAARHRAATNAGAYSRQLEDDRRARLSEKDHYNELVEIAEDCAVEWLTGVGLDPTGVEFEVIYVEKPKPFKVDGNGMASLPAEIVLGWRTIDHDFRGLVANSQVRALANTRMVHVEMQVIPPVGEPRWMSAPDLAGIGEALLMEEEYRNRLGVQQYIGTIFEPE